MVIERVDGRSGVARFIDVPFRLYRPRRDAWIPPLRMTVRDALDTRGNPFYRKADRALFVAHDGDAVLGRVAAIENRWHNDHHDDRVGFFGFLDAVEQDEVVAKLLSAAEGWLADRGLDRARGPMSPSMNHECGLLVDGFDLDPVMMTPWHPPYLGALVRQAGYAPAKDLLAYYLPAGTPEDLAVPERMVRLAERARRRSGITFRTLDLKVLESEARLVLELYNEAWADNWGFVPPSWDEFWHTARELKTVLAPDLSFVAEVDGEIIGFWLIAKDVNRVLRSVRDGRLWPWNVIKLMRGLRSADGHRVVLLGLRSSYRNRGLMSLFADEAARRGVAMGKHGAEASWILEDNEALVGPLTALGYTPNKRWRIYEKKLG